MNEETNARWHDKEYAKITTGQFLSAPLPTKIPETILYIAVETYRIKRDIKKLDNTREKKIKEKRKHNRDGKSRALENRPWTQKANLYDLVFQLLSFSSTLL